MRFLPVSRAALPFDPASLSECKESSPFSSFEIAIRNRFAPESRPLKPDHSRQSTVFSTSSYASTGPLLGYHPRSSSYLSTGSYRPEYDEGSLAKVLAAIGLVLSFLVGSALVSLGVYLCIDRTTEWKYGQAEGWRTVPLGSVPAEALPLPLYLAITLVTESTGFSHGTALKWQLLEERRLEFNANLRFLTASGQWINGRIMNAILFLTLIATNSATSFVFVSVQDSAVVLVSYLPLIILGTAVIIQASLSTIAVIYSKIPTWSSSIVDVGPALLAQDITRRIPGRCMRAIDDGHPIDQTPIMPRPIQPSLWDISGWRESVRLTVIFPVILAALFLAGFAFVMHKLQGDWNVWANLTRSMVLSGYGSGVLPAVRLAWAFAVICVIQFPVTLALHVCELTVLMSRDEAIWKAACTKGARSLNPVMTVIGNWQSVLLLVAKPFCHWVSGQAVNFQVLMSGSSSNGAAALTVRPVFVVVLAGLLFCLSVFVFLVAIWRPKNHQPAAYGHLQTLINLVDEWSLVMYWGHKGFSYSDEIYHAGTSKEKLSPVIPGAWYQ